jgi:hypothetical protein
MFLGPQAKKPNNRGAVLGFRHEVHEICVLLSYCAVAAYSDNSLSTFRDNLSAPDLEDGTDRLSWNVGKELSLYGA